MQPLERAPHLKPLAKLKLKLAKNHVSNPVAAHDGESAREKTFQKSCV